MIDFIQGPLWVFATVVFGVGVTLRIGTILFLGVKKDRALSRGSAIYGGVGTVFRRFLPRRENVKTSRFHIIAGYLFHVGLFALLLFAAPHIRFLEEKIFGFGWSPMPHWAFIVSAQAAFTGLILLWLRRIMHPVMRFLSTLDDHLAAGLTFFAMFTGCLALFESYAQLRILHLLSVEILMIYFPFSNLMHAFTFLISRASTGASTGRHGVKA
jgi:nitrate reductase gamma subunit